MAAGAGFHWLDYRLAARSVRNRAAGLVLANKVATAVLTRCNTYEQKRVVLAVVLFRISREQVLPIFAGVMRIQYEVAPPHAPSSRAVQPC
jgi:hypothetical protein